MISNRTILNHSPSSYITPSSQFNSNSIPRKKKNPIPSENSPTRKRNEFHKKKRILGSIHPTHTRGTTRGFSFAGNQSSKTESSVDRKGRQGKRDGESERASNRVPYRRLAYNRTSGCVSEETDNDGWLRVMRVSQTLSPSSPLAWPGLAWPGLAWHGMAQERSCALILRASDPRTSPDRTVAIAASVRNTPQIRPLADRPSSLSPPPSTPLLSMSPPSSANFSTLLTFSQWMETVFRGRGGEGRKGRREKNRKHFRKQSTFRGGALFFLFPSLFFSLFSDLRGGWGEGGFVDWRIFGSLLCFLSEGMN